MKKICLISALILVACQAPSQSSTQSSTQSPETFEDLLRITDKTEQKICTLPLTAMKQQLSNAEIEAAKAKAFDFGDLILDTASDPAAQIRILFRRSALRRRLSVDESAVELASGFYEDFKAKDALPTTLKGFHDEFHFWMERISEQSQYGAPDSAAYNMRFCVMNERRAELHAASRKDILARMDKGIQLPAPELIENINHETSFEDGFAPGVLKRIFTKENTENLTALARAQMRSDESILPFDPTTADLFWEKRDEEIAALTEFIQSHNFSVPADKLALMTDIDQSLRKLFSSAKASDHFASPEDYEKFKKGIGDRVIRIDDFNTAELKTMLSGRAWFRDDQDGKGAAHSAWLIAQHADRDPDFQVRALELIEADIDAPGVSKSNFAYLYDRVQMRFQDSKALDQRVQKYGTQGRCTGPGTWEPFTVESPETIDQIRQEVGLGTMAQYKSRFKDICQEDQR